jgi:pimeloyl-ACP methyl ester carboxylesterase
VQIERGTIGRFPYAALGSGRPLVVLAGLSPTTGIGSDASVVAKLLPLAALARTRRLVLLNRRSHLSSEMTMADFAAEHADAIRRGVGAPVDVVGVSTGGSIAQQLAADHRDTVRRLLLVSAACRLGPAGRQWQRRIAARIRAGGARQAQAVMATGLVPPGRGQIGLAVAASLLHRRVTRHQHNLDDLAITIEAEDGFDLAACHAPIQARTLIIAGRADRFYSPDLFEQTARLIPDCDLRLLHGRGHMTVMSDPAFRHEVVAFLG